MRMIHIVAALALLSVTACNKDIQLEPVSFDVKADSTEYNAGSLASFAITGKPNYVSFYSGEMGRRHQFINRDTAVGIPKLQFSTQLNAGAQANTLSLMVSTDFVGGVNASSDPNAIAAASWTDISGRAAWATSATSKPSGVIDLSDFAAAGKPVYIAFKYKAEPGSVQNKWTITGLSLRNALDDGSSYVIDTLPSFTTVLNYGNSSHLPGWAGKTVANTYAWVLSATNLVITGASTVAAATAPSEAWAISGPVNLRQVTPDAGIGIQTVNNNNPVFTYRYLKPGTYTATFLASNINVDEMNSDKKNVTITVK